MPTYDGGNHGLETGGLIGTPLNGKRFWRKRSDHNQRSMCGNGGERKIATIIRYLSSMSIVLDVQMTLDLKEPRLNS